MSRRKDRRRSTRITMPMPAKEPITCQQDPSAQLSYSDWRLYMRLKRNGKILGSKVFS